MSRLRFDLIVFLAGCVAVCWIAAGYVASPLALAVSVLIAVCYVTGALELQRYQQATGTLERALDALRAKSAQSAQSAQSARPASLDAWLDTLDPGLRNAVRLRVEGARAALPGPALTPYLVGLLVLLGMLGTLLGMVATLKGTGAALEGATDLQAIRASLAAPVKGLGFAFGTSIAGVATSAALGMMSALSRRRRGAAAQRLDSETATTLHAFSHAHRREASLALMQRQAEAMPALVDRLDAMMQTIERQSLALNERLATSQRQFLGETEAAYKGLAASVAQSLAQSVTDSARAASAAIGPVVESTMASVKAETAAMQRALAQAVDRQMAGLTTGLDSATATIATQWRDALADQRRTNETLAADLRATLDRYADTFAQRSTGLVDGVAETLARVEAQTAATQHSVAQAVDRQLAGLATSLDGATSKISTQWHDALAEQRRTNETLAADLRATLERYAETFEQRSTGLVDGVAARLDDMSATLSQSWHAALAQQTQHGEQLAGRHEQALTAAAATFEQHAAAFVRTVGESHAQLQSGLASQDEARLAAWRDSVASMAAALRAHCDETAAQTASRQQAICETLERTAHAITEQTQAQARETIAEISRLVEAAAEAPRAAADVVAELRQKLSDSMARDTAILEERGRLLATIETLLGAVNHASTEQRAAIDALVTTSADLLERVGTRFTDRVAAEADRLDGIAAEVTRGAVEVASLGDAFGAAVHAFGESNDKLVAHLERIEGALDKSVARSDEQLAYYVAQAREVIDLSMLSQKQIVENLQQLAERRAAAGADAP